MIIVENLIQWTVTFVEHAHDRPSSSSIERHLAPAIRGRPDPIAAITLGSWIQAIDNAVSAGPGLTHMTIPPSTLSTCPVM